ncbi:MAG: hypothetical protein HYR48_07725 [Gemmatimonadetes bacterium]|nr:hypothetical protein [Gemmatimonadota bacterium]
MRTLHSARRAGALAVSGLLLFGIVAPLNAQIGRLRRAVARAAESVDPRRLLESPPPITTNLDDAVWAVDSLDSHNPNPGVFSPLTALARGPHGGFVLRPGHFAMQAQSYCLKAGTHGPGGGDGYLYAPPRGPAEDQVMSIVRNSVQHPGIHQHDIQLLLWAIIARAKFENLQPNLKAVAAQLLTPQQVLTLNRSAWELAGPALEQAMASLPEPAQQVLRAESQLRDMLTSASSSFEDMERVAVLAGVAPRGEGSRDVPSGRWSRHPDGYYMRYLPAGYSSTRVEVWVPEGSPAVGREFDPATHIAVPGNTARQRLIQSARERTQS